MTPAEARAEIIDALTTAGAPATSQPGGLDPPYVYVIADGIEPNRIPAGQADAGFTLVLVGGAWDEESAALELDALKLIALQTVRGLDGWIVGAVGPDGGRDWAGGIYLSADMGAARRVDL